MSKSYNFIKRALQSLPTYITPALLIFLVLSRLTWRWKYMIEQVIGQRLFFAVLAVSVIALIVVHRRRIADFMKLTVVKTILIMAILGIAVYQKVSPVEFLILAYALFAFFFLRTYNAAFKVNLMKTVETITDIFNNEGRTPAVFALLCIITAPVLLILKKSGAAEQLAIYAYYFLVLTVVLQMLEVKLRIERENKLLDLLKEAYIHSRNAMPRAADLIRKINWASFRRSIFSTTLRFIFRSTLYKISTFIAVILLIVVAQSVSWKKLIKTIEMKPEYQSQLTLVDHDQRQIVFAPTVNEAMVPIRITHPLSNPRVWPNAGANPVRIGVLWFEQGSAGDRHNAVFEERHDLDKPLFINSSKDMRIILKRPPLPGGRSYEVHLSMVHDGVRWFGSDNGAVAKMNVSLQSLRGRQRLTRELQILQQARLRLAEAWSEQLMIAPDNYKSKIELLGKADSVGLKSIKLAVTNKSKIPWPAVGKNPVQIGVIWIQKIKEQDKVIHTHIGEEVFPLAEPLLPSKREIVEIRFDPFKYPEADEIWVGMVQSGKNWFYRWKDDVIKLAKKRDVAALDPEIIEAESLKVLREAKHLESINLAILNGINDASIADRDKYRSRIRLNNASPEETWQVSARAIMDLDLSITNMGSVAWPIGVEKPVNIGVLWFKKGSSPISYTQAISEERCYLPRVLMSGSSVDVNCKILPKIVPGQYEVWIGLVHEGNSWFYKRGDSVLKLNVNVQ